MAPNPGRVLRSSSPVSSEGSPQRGRRGLRLQDESLTTSKGFKRYAAGVDRVLGLFDTTLEEWADYISFLGRLLKALHNHPEGVTVVPRKHIVGKRLAQCLHPSLPSGVHQKALEVYTFIFGFIGKDGLAQDLSVYLPGMASTLTFASIPVRPLFLSLIENHVLKVPIGALRPALKALILALLPGLEEETSDEFETTLQILSQCKQVFSSAGVGEFFWQNLFLASITSPGRRQGILVYLNRNLPKLGDVEQDSDVLVEGEVSINAEIAAVTTPEPGLLLRCFATGLADEQALVQRAFLDLLVTHLPLHASIFHQGVVAEDLALLISAAVGVVLRRDMSLNRRLWSWFLGPEVAQNSERDSLPSSSKQGAESHPSNGVGTLDLPSYFQTYCAHPLTRSLEAMILNDSQIPSKVSRPFRIALSLMDRWEIGSPVVKTIFLPLIRSLLEYQQNATSREDFEEVFRSANVFFDGVESTLIWSNMLTLVLSAEKSKEDILQHLDLATFIIANFNVREEEMVVLHIPLVSLAMLENLSQTESSGSCDASRFVDHEVESKMFQVLDLLVDMIPERVFSSGRNAVSTSNTPGAKDVEVGAVLDTVRSFFDDNQDAVKLSESPFRPETLRKHFLKLLTPMISVQIYSDATGMRLARHIQTFSRLFEKLPFHDGLDRRRLVEALKQRLVVKRSSPRDLPFSFVSSATALFVSFYIGNSSNEIMSSDDLTSICPMLVRRLWAHLSFSSPQHHIETVRLLEDLHHHVWQEELVTSTILSLVVDAEAESCESYRPSREALERYFTLWTHSHNDFRSLENPNTEAIAARKPPYGPQTGSAAAFASMLSRSMLTVLTVLRGPQTEVYASCRNWLQSLPEMSSILDTVIMPIRKSLGLGNNTHVSADNLEVGGDMIEILNQLVAVQSRDQWLRFSHQRGWNSHDLPFSKSKGSVGESLQICTAKLCRDIIERHELCGEEVTDRQILRLQRASLNLLQQLFSNSKEETILELQIDHLLVAQLGRPLVLQAILLQSDLLDTLLVILNSKIAAGRSREVTFEPSLNQNMPETRSKMNSAPPSSSKDKPSELDQGHIVLAEPPKDLLICLLNGIGNPSTQDVIQKWLQLTCESTYFYTSSTFSVLMRIVECFCKQIGLCFDGLKTQYQNQTQVGKNFEYPLSHLLNAVDFVLARAHERLMTEEEGMSTLTSQELQQGFFGNIVSGALSSEAKQARNNTNTNNSRLTVILCFQDALRTCFRLWSWQTSDLVDASETLASFQQASQKIRGRSRRILENLLAAEPLEGIEALAHVWVKALVERETVKTESLLSLVHTLQGSRPGITMAAIFNAIYSRTNPTALPLSQKSTLSSDLHESDLIAFLGVYAHSLEDDVLEEIWRDCTTFLRDVLGNPMPHRLILTRLIGFVSILSAKMENTNFGEERKMRRELADLFIRLLTAIFTIKLQSSSREKTAGPSIPSGLAAGMGSDNVEETLHENFAALSALLDDPDRLIAVVVNVVSNVIAPMFRSRQFPQNLTTTTLSLLLKISRIPNATKAWKKELTDSFNDPRFFCSQMPIVKVGWLPLLRQLAFAEKSLLPELLSRLSAPTAAGIMFGVGATAARLESDKKAQLNLRRVSCVLLAVENDTFAAHLGLLQTKLEELLSASFISSPSSATRAEIYMVIRALVLESSPNQMASFWPMISTELRATFSSVFDDHDDSPPSAYNNYSLLQAAKLLDVLLLINHEDFQAQEWVFVTDTVDAIYRPEDWETTALIDEVAQSMMDVAEVPKSAHTPFSIGNALAAPNDAHRVRKPWLSGDQTRVLPQADIRDGLLRPFFGHLSIHVYERTYSLSDPDFEACKDDLLADLFNESTIVGT